MKRRDLEKHLRSHGCVLEHHGGRHDVWSNPHTGSEAPVPRHNELKTDTARGICKQLGISPAPGK